MESLPNDISEAHNMAFGEVESPSPLLFIKLNLFLKKKKKDILYSKKGCGFLPFTLKIAT